jgi:hypothetical protein
VRRSLLPNWEGGSLIPSKSLIPPVSIRDRRGGVSVCGEIREREVYVKKEIPKDFLSDKRYPPSYLSSLYGHTPPRYY